MHSGCISVRILSLDMQSKYNESTGLCTLQAIEWDPLVLLVFPPASLRLELLQSDALKHVFASRIADINNSPHWNLLSFISCARNGLVLMDDSLQLLPAMETLDLRRNKFTRVDNLWKCTKLKHLDLGFNQLRNIASFCGVNIACSS